MGSRGVRQQVERGRGLMSRGGCVDGLVARRDTCWV